MIRKDDLPKTVIKQLAYENRTFLRAIIPIEPSEFVAAYYEVCHNGRIYSYPDLQDAVNKFNEEVSNGM